jgi:lipoate synthase
MFKFKDDIRKLERKIKQIKRVKPQLKTRIGQLITKYNKTNLTGLVLYTLPELEATIEKIDDFTEIVLHNLETAIKFLEQCRKDYGETYKYSLRELPEVNEQES